MAEIVEGRDSFEGSTYNGVYNEKCSHLGAMSSQEAKKMLSEGLSSWGKVSEKGHLEVNLQGKLRIGLAKKAGQEI